MESQAIHKKICSILRDKFSSFDIDLELLSHINFVDDIGLDSISFIELIVEIESAFDVEIPDEYLTAEHFDTLEKIELTVQQLLG